MSLMSLNYLVALLLCRAGLTLGTTLKTGTVNKTCTKEQFKYVYTECDVSNGRWKVAVPISPKLCKPENAPVPERGTKCTFECPEGEYLEIESQKCKKCAAGTYSLNGGIRYGSWKKLPDGFDTWGADPYEHEHPRANKKDCKSQGWTPKGDFIESAGASCKSVLVYSATLQKPGNISVVHRADDNLAFFRVKVVNDFCTTSKNGKHTFFMDSEMKWKRTYVPLQQGRNVIFLEATYLYEVTSSSSFQKELQNGQNGVESQDRSGLASTDSPDTSSRRRKTVQIREFKVTGLSYTSECTKCEPGTYSPSDSSSCKACDANTFSTEGADACTKCASDEYSDAGSSKCLKRPECTNKDFYEMWSACDLKGKTKKSFFWVVPKICEGGAQIPKMTTEIDCPPCNPGQFKNGSGCLFCKSDEYSYGLAGCKKCPPSTTPDVGLFFRWWQNLPAKLFNFFCFSKTERSCKTGNGWRQYNTYMDSGIGHSDDTEVGLSFTVPGFKHIHSELTIEFEMECKSKCHLTLESKNQFEARSLIFEFHGKKRKTKFTHRHTGVGKVVFHLQFSKPEGDRSNLYDYPEDRVKLYALNLTNAVNGGADKCIDCPLGVGAQGKGCIQCEKGSYLENKKCVKCPAGTYLDTKLACLPCSKGTSSLAGATHCYSDCHLRSENRQYNFSALAGPMLRKNGRMFTSHGYPFYRIFNITVCGGADAISHCYNNYTDGEDADKVGKLSFVKSAVCRSTVIPSQKEKNIFTQSMSLGDFLESVTFGSLNKHKPDKNETAVDAKKTRRRVRRDDHKFNDSLPIDVNFIFKSVRPTTHCENGYSTVVTLRCDITAAKKGYIRTLEKCPAGTCDGCMFRFYWHSEYACPLCTSSDYRAITSACNNGKVETQHAWNEPKWCREGVQLPAAIIRTCSVFERTILDLKLFLFVFLGAAILLVCGIVILCLKNRKLTYNYSRLIDEGNWKNGELPASEKCALDDGEEDEVILSRGPGGNGRRILDRLRKKIGSPKNQEDFSGFETINLTERVVDHSSGDEI